MADKKSLGFSFIEVIVGVFLLEIMLISLISVIILGFNLLSKTKQISLATQIVQEEMEWIRNRTFDEIAELETTFGNNNLSLLKDGRGYITVEEGPGEDIKKISVRVCWIYRGKEMNKGVVTYIAREGINRK